MVISTHMVKTRENTIAKIIEVSPWWDGLSICVVQYIWLSGCQMQMLSCNTVNHNNSKVVLV